MYKPRPTTVLHHYSFSQKVAVGRADLICVIVSHAHLFVWFVRVFDNVSIESRFVLCMTLNSKDYFTQTMVCYGLSINSSTKPSSTIFFLLAEGEHNGGGQGPPISLPLPKTSREDLRLDGYLKYPYAVKTLYIYKHPCLLRDSNPTPTAQQSASLTTILDGRLLRV
ncbi:uncharacterized protein TNCV_2787201 [Trichonephila clavipes]|uniref:Uncharacterized protein n=1 Tax=Trichonephila clavipes TaxID=2585209 RepID=A0A8X6T1D7_TRICX|nr:uncharacterized protein TNCV_2787201 [Trichonephila clavipes]